MEIKAGCIHDYKTTKAFVRAGTLKARVNSNAFMILYLVLLGYLDWRRGDNYTFTLIWFGFMLLFNGYMFFVVPRIDFRRLGAMKNAKCEYVFSDNGMQITKRSEQYNGNSECAYGVIPKVLETSKYLYIFQTKNQASIVDKTTLSEGDMERLRNTLKEKISGKYTVRR